MQSSPNHQEDAEPPDPDPWHPMEVWLALFYACALGTAFAYLAAAIFG